MGVINVMEWDGVSYIFSYISYTVSYKNTLGRARPGRRRQRASHPMHGSESATELHERIEIVLEVPRDSRQSHPVKRWNNAADGCILPSSR